MENLDKIRNSIDSIDDKIVELFQKRMQLVSEVAKNKMHTNKNVLDVERENKILYRITENKSDQIKKYIKILYDTIFATSKSYQNSIMGVKSDTVEQIGNLLNNKLLDMPLRSAVACQGIKGANSGVAAQKIFSICDISYFKNFESVFLAVEKGLCEYGVLPIENSTVGSVNEVYDLMKKHKFYIVSSIRVKIEHCLAGIKDTNLSNIKKIISHQQALSQCSLFIEKNKYITEKTENTAVGAKIVSELNDNSVGVLCSKECAKMYGLKILQDCVQNNNNNYTRFICISKTLQIYKYSDKISVMTALSHKAGSLNNVLTKFSSLGLNLTKIESRPIVGADFEFMFYFDFIGNIENSEVLSLIGELENSSDKFTLLGIYKEII